MLKGYYQNELHIGSGTWIGQQCFLHSAGGIRIGKNVGIGPGVKILTSQHQLNDPATPILHEPLEFAEVSIGDGVDIGVNSVILPGVELGPGVQVGAGAVVSRSFPKYSIAVGVPARLLKTRERTRRSA